MIGCGRILGAGLASFVVLAAQAANCGIDSMSEAGKYGFTYRPAFFDVAKSYELRKAFLVGPDDPLIYRKTGKRDTYLTVDSDVSYSSDWFLAIKFKLKAGRKYPALNNPAGGTDLQAIAQSGGAGNTQLLYVNADGKLCERVGSVSVSSPLNVTALVKGNYAADPDVRLSRAEVIDPQYAAALSIAIKREGPSMWTVTANYFLNDVLKLTHTKNVDRNADRLELEGYVVRLAKSASGELEATVVGEPDPAFQDGVLRSSMR